MGCTTSSAAPVSPMKSDAVNDGVDRNADAAKARSVPEGSDHAGVDGADGVVRRLHREEPGRESAPAASAAVENLSQP